MSNINNGHEPHIGDMVKIYEDPVTCLRLEGTARIISIHNTAIDYDGRRTTMVRCRFNDDIDGMVVYRRYVWNLN